MASAGRAERTAELLPARWVDVAGSAADALATAAAAMQRHRYSLHATDAAGVSTYRFGSPAAEFVSDALSLGLVLRVLGRPDGWAELAVWTVPVDGGVRLTVSLVEGVFHATEVRKLLVELVEAFRAGGTLIDASELLSALDLPENSPGRPRRSRRGRA